MSMAILPKQKGEEDKVAQGVLRLLEEDPTLKFVNNAETHQMILSGLGEQHLDVVVSKLKGKFGLDVTLENQKLLTVRRYGKKCRHKENIKNKLADMVNLAMFGLSLNQVIVRDWNLKNEW